MPERMRGSAGRRHTEDGGRFSDGILPHAGSFFRNRLGNEGISGPEGQGIASDSEKEYAGTVLYNVRRSERFYMVRGTAPLRRCREENEDEEKMSGAYGDDCSSGGAVHAARAHGQRRQRAYSRHRRGRENVGRVL